MSLSLPGCRPLANAWRQLPLFHRKCFECFLPDCPQRPHQTPASGCSHSSLGTISGLLPILLRCWGHALVSQGPLRNAVTGTDDVLEVWCSITSMHRGSCSPGGYCASLVASCPPETLRRLRKAGCILAQTARTPVLRAV